MNPPNCIFCGRLSVFEMYAYDDQIVEIIYFCATCFLECKVCDTCNFGNFDRKCGAEPLTDSSL